MTESVENERELVIKVVAMPSDTNPGGDMFGGWIVSQMDLAAYLHVRKMAQSRIVTVAIDHLVFHKPVYVGDCVICYARVEKVGRTSITVNVEVVVERHDSYEEEKVTEGRFVFVAVDDNRQPVALIPKEAA
jgi:acyl-CoA thioesterase YciA